MPRNTRPESTRFIVKTAIEGKDDQTYWRTIGTCWHNPAAGDHPESISIQLDALPLGGRLRAWLPDDD